MKATKPHTLRTRTQESGGRNHDRTGVVPTGTRSSGRQGRPSLGRPVLGVSSGALRERIYQAEDMLRRDLHRRVHLVGDVGELALGGEGFGEMVRAPLNSRTRRTRMRMGPRWTASMACESSASTERVLTALSCGSVGDLHRSYNPRRSRRLGQSRPRKLTSLADVSRQQRDLP